jgi:hypothetical protein
MPPPPVDRSWVEQLARIGGLNPFGKPMLQWVWGATHADPMAIDGGLKYWIGQTEDTLRGFTYIDPKSGAAVFVERLDKVPAAALLAVPTYGHTELGQRRIIIENWRSKAFLAASNRYTETTRRDPDTTKEFFFCAACHEPIDAKPEVLQQLGATPPCSKCGSKRCYVRAAHFEGDGKLLHEAPEEGVYDCFMILENALGEPMEPDGWALHLIEAAWKKHSTQSMREQINELLDDAAPQQELQRAASSPTNPFVGPAVPGW